MKRFRKLFVLVAFGLVPLWVSGCASDGADRTIAQVDAILGKVQVQARRVAQTAREVDAAATALHDAVAAVHGQDAHATAQTGK